MARELTLPGSEYAKRRSQMIHALELAIDRGATPTGQDEPLAHHLNLARELIDSSGTLDSIEGLTFSVAQADHHARRDHSARHLWERLVDHRRSTAGPDHPDTLNALNTLAVTYTHLGRHQDALTLNEQVAADRQRVLGDDHPDTFDALGNLANTYTHLGRRQDALTLNEQVAADRQRVLGDDHPDTLTAVSYTHLTLPTSDLV